MSEKGSVFQKGSGGNNFEQLVQTAFLITLIIRGHVPCITSGKLSEIALQVTNRGYETDDFMVVAKTTTKEHRLLFQAKHDVSFTPKNDKFNAIINAFWKDFNNTSIFDKTRDKLIVVKNGLTKDERNHIKTLFNWANNHATETDFFAEVNRINVKKDRLNVFREVLKVANNNTALTKKELWEFLKCLDVLEYDFLNEGSVDKAYFLNLIKLSKSKNSTASEKEIWNSVFAYVANHNPNGGSTTIESIKDEDFFQHFDNAQLSPYFKAVEKLKSDSQEILRPIKTSIGKDENKFQLPRIEARGKILEGITNSQFTIVTGKPGVGKSAGIKQIIQKDLPNASIFVFRADQFNESTIANVFSSQGVNETIKDIFSCISLIPEKFIFIDSLEKLLEADPECAFNQLLTLLKDHPEIRLIASSRKYAIDLITLKFGIDKNNISVIDIPTLNEEELKLVAEKFPQLNSVLKNIKIKKLLESPKYLDFSILAINKTNDDYANVSLTEFKDKLWNSLVVDSTKTKNGLPIKREDAFIEIAVKRAKEMKLFTKPNKSNAEAIACLENDEIIFQEKNNRKYSPTHDILEDWALVKYVSLKFEDFPKPKDFFSHLGSEPAIRRAFRLWVEDYLIDNSEKIFELIKATIIDQTIEKYWTDELLTATFRAENSSSFFTFFEKELLADNAAFFNRCLHIIKTCCKESDQNTSNNDLLLPTGSGWKEALFFIQKQISKLDEMKFSILNFLADWYFRLLFQYNKIETLELEAVKSIVVHYLIEIEAENEFWQEKNAKKKSKDLITILFGLAESAKEEIEQLIARAFVNKENRNLWRLKSFYEDVIESCLSGVGNYLLIKELPKLIIETAWKYWKYIPPKNEDFSEDRIYKLVRHSISKKNCWGVKEGRSSSPSGIYKTPFYNLLRFHPSLGLKFIIDFINYSVEFYINSSCEYKHNISQIDIELNNGSVVKKWGSWELWLAYRGSSVTNYILESLLMSFEKFLLELAERKTEESKKNLKFIFEYVLKNCNNVAPLGVLTSVAISYPEEVEEAMLPLLSVREFYKWDLDRAFKECSTFEPMDFDIPFAQKERWRLNQLPHRKRYTCGLKDFIVDYQFNIGKINPQIHNIFDKLNSEIKENDVIWKKMLNEIDIRNLELQSYDEKLGGVVVQVKYEKDVAEHIASNQVDLDEQETQATYSRIISKAYEKKETINYEKWTECYNYYSDTRNMNILFSKPITLAILGLDDFSIVITEEQKNWCIETISNAIEAILQDTFTRNGYNHLEKEIASSSFHLLMKNIKDDSDRNGIIAAMISLLSFDQVNDKITQYVREIFFELFPNEAKRVWLGLIKYSDYKKTYPKPPDSFDKEKLFIQKVSSDKNLKLDLSAISIENCKSSLLARAFMITPYNAKDKDFSNFVNYLLPIILDDLSKEDYSYNGNEEIQQFYDESISIEQYLANLFLDADFSYSKPIFEKMVDSLSFSVPNQKSARNGTLDFVNNTLDLLVLKLFDNGNGKTNQTRYAQQQNNFWNLWDALFDLIPENKSHPLTPKLLLDIRYLGKPNETNWSVLNGKKQFYKKVVLEKGRNEIPSVIKVLSTIGGEEFLPEGISWLTDIFKSNNNDSLSLATDSSERMIKRLFYDHILEIKKDKTLLDDYIWILNKMVDLGSSAAYLFRENVITYKNYGK